MQKNNAYFHVSNRGCGIVGVVGKISKTNIWGHWNSRGLEKTESFNSWGGGGGGGGGGGFFIVFFFFFLTMETTVLRTFVYAVKVK